MEYYTNIPKMPERIEIVIAEAIVISITPVAQYPRIAPRNKPAKAQI
jgi:hypothetical protein